jgi:hypothetical protein
MAIAIGNKVRHKHHRELGIGEVQFLQPVAGVTKFVVTWPSKPGTYDSHTESELEAILPFAERLRPGDVGPASFTPFTLRVMGRWFEARHALTGELSNQPFQMLPHQVIVTNRVVTSDANKRNWLIADDVGLGKTIEAGMIMEVLRKRSLGRFRCLFITPAGLKTQWVEEMKLRFGRRARLPLRPEEEGSGFQRQARVGQRGLRGHPYRGVPAQKDRRDHHPPRRGPGRSPRGSRSRGSRPGRAERAFE